MIDNDIATLFNLSDGSQDNCKLRFPRTVAIVCKKKKKKKKKQKKKKDKN